ncbi:transglutaminase family protein [Paracoccus spongiarum]|uniref:Transglutaminase family protein n=1 Tax=Paracoccus spongiarum TaxID=3064387 RepID=A0ABT9JDC8_9RHOB|nr:transglutaminase family protein [Paracoccus sp. 2205BS29-5]MDP5307838.1 transglutaminase family protein [Paracoccus sp. 2205BS29-5]
MRYRLRLTIRHDFRRPIGAGRQLLRICPRDIPGLQQVLRCHVAADPEPLEEAWFRDFFGNEVIELVLPAGLSSLRFDMTAQILRHSTSSSLDLSAPLPRLGEELAEITDLGPDSPHHFLAASPHIPAVPEITAFAARSSRDAGTACAAVEQLGHALHRIMRFDPEATEVDTPIATAFAGRHGVCQDFSQIMIAALRSLGIPAAYVSGFLRTLPPPGRPRLEGADAMHAWVRAWTGIEAGWVEFDPTNACFVSADHVTIGYGRDYSDTAPVTGMMRLVGSQTGTHSVDLVEEAG